MADRWYIRRDGQRHGPYSAGQMRQMTTTGQLLPVDLVSEGEDDEWVPASRFGEWFDAAPAMTKGRMAMSEEWFYAVGGEQAGPVSWGELKRLADDGKLAATDMVWNESMAEWAEAGTVEGLVPKTPAARKPPPLPKKVVPPAVPDTAQATRVFGEIVMQASGSGTTLGADTNDIEVYLDEKLLGTGSVEAGIRLTFETTVGDHTFRLSMSGVQAGAPGGKFLRKLTDAVGARLNSRYPVGFTSPGHYLVTFKPKRGLLIGPQLPTEIEVTNR